MPAMKSLSLTLLLTLLLPLSAAAAAEMTAEPVKSAAMTESPAPPDGGGWASIKNIKDPHIQELGRFAVKEFNKQSKLNHLNFQSVFKGETWVVSGTIYKLLLKAKDGPIITRICEATVMEKPLEKLRKLTSFVVISRKRD